MKYRIILYIVLVPLIAIGFVWLFLQASALLTQPRRAQATSTSANQPGLVTPIPDPTAAAATAATAVTVSPSPSSAVRVIVGPFTDQQAPDFALTTLDGQPARLADYRGKLLVINFWASWCGPCKEEMPLLQAAYEQHKDNGLLVLGINTTYQDDRKKAEAFVQETGATFPILMDEDGSTSQDYRVISIPMSFFVDRAGNVRHVQMGSMNENQLKQSLDDLLK